MIILITGGSSGLGEAITRRLATDANNFIYFTYNRSVENARQIESDFANTKAIKCDFKLYEEVNQLCSQVAELNPDVLINNAYFGSFMKTHFHKTPIEEFLAGFKENIIPTLTITQAAINVFRKKKEGKIITVLTSALLNIPPTGSAVYIANKAYLEKMTKVWAAENARYNITSNTISPAFMLTNFTKDIDERIVEQMRENNPLQKILTTREAAESVVFLTTASSQVNGIDIVINAGSAIK